MSMNREQVLQILYELALVSGGEPRAKPLTTRTLQRLLYHSDFSCGVFITDITKNQAENYECRLEQVVGCGVLLDRKGVRFELPEGFTPNHQPGLITDKAFIEQITGAQLKYRAALRLPVNAMEEFILLSRNVPALKIPYERIVEPILMNFGKTLKLCRDIENHTRMLELEIAEREKVEYILRDSEVRHRTIFERTVDGIINITDTGIIESVNPAVEKLFGYSNAELVGNNVSMLMPEPHASQHNLFISKYKQTGEAKILGRGRELFARKKDGTIFPIDIGLDEMLIHDKRMFTGIIRDITERKAIEAETLKAKEEAERANLAKSEFLSSMSHELRTPLNAILGFGQLMELDKTLSVETQGNIKEIIRAGYHLLELINEVLDLAKVESGHLNLSIEPIEYDKLVSECIALIEPIAASHEIRIQNLTAPNNITLKADRSRIKQAIINLLSNAIKYNRPGGQVTISISQDIVDFCRISVQDTGFGIKEEYLDNLFEAFNRLGAESTDIEGTGIGLVFTKRLVELMGGRIGVKSQYGVGSHFWIELPIASSVFATDKFTKTQNTSPQAATDSNEYKILYIEDNPANVRLVVQLLANRPHIQLFTAHTPGLGLELAALHKPDLILLDINLPEYDGYKALEKLKNTESTDNIPVVAISANAMPNDLKKAEEAGFTSYLTKPINIKAFYEMLDEMQRL